MDIFVHTCRYIFHLCTCSRWSWQIFENYNLMENFNRWIDGLREWVTTALIINMYIDCVWKMTSNLYISHTLSHDITWLHMFVTHMFVTWLSHGLTHLSHDYHMASHVCHMIIITWLHTFVIWLSHGFTCLSHVCHMIITWLHMFVTWLSHGFTCLSHDYHMASYVCHMIITCLSHGFTCLSHGLIN